MREPRMTWWNDDDAGAGDNDDDDDHDKDHLHRGGSQTVKSQMMILML